MINWKHASKDDLKRLKAIKIILDEHEKLLDFLFHPAKACLASSPESLKEKMRCFSSGEQVLLLIAMDVWGTYGGIHFDDLYTSLSDKSLKNCIKALSYVKNNL